MEQLRQLPFAPSVGMHGVPSLPEVDYDTDEDLDERITRRSFALTWLRSAQLSAQNNSETPR
jgi:hypothetical protein